MRNVVLDNKFEPGQDPADFVEIEKSNDRHFEVQLYNRGRWTRGTATIWRLRFLFERIKKRYPSAWSGVATRIDKPVVVRRRKFGRIIMTVKALSGPVASVASKH